MNEESANKGIQVTREARAPDVERSSVERLSHQVIA
jgi:hypothetical protein